MTLLPTGYLFKDCVCCGRRLGGSTTDPFKVCRRCEKAGCNPRRYKDDAVRCER